MNKVNIALILRNFSIFKELTDDELQKIVEVTQTREFQKNSHVFMQEESMSTVYFIEEGIIKIYRIDFNGREQIVSVLREGEMFPHIGFFKKGNYPANAIVVERAKLIAISVSDFEQVLLNYPEVSVKLFRVMGEKIIDLQNRLEAQILNNIYEQVIKLLLRLGQTHGSKGENHKTTLSTYFTNKELANMIGSTRETVSRTITKLKKKELVTTNEEGNFVLETSLLKEELYNELD
ncbi:Crp/Fnr family transcriptional regulator [Bacillus sp. HMF5848]|uniref:Crp/Fnr family transcriptional regulator n=1 Tax=Bacillus sp. HMF5848 TaxID=2495421 RepID=UPI000F78B72D|nr:Crp/Fnr family transcriptional regulator [Bacillus sp. HMF5848]RSK27933.1 Crp/Fnr family transcriptional regulator [Bacillus sp. HMF5848]